MCYEQNKVLLVHLENIIFVGVTKTSPSSSGPHNRSKHSGSEVVHISCINTKRFGMYRYLEYTNSKAKISL